MASGIAGVPEDPSMASIRRNHPDRMQRVEHYREVARSISYLRPALIEQIVLDLCESAELFYDEGMEA